MDDEPEKSLAEDSKQDSNKTALPQPENNKTVAINQIVKAVANASKAALPQSNSHVNVTVIMQSPDNTTHSKEEEISDDYLKAVEKTIKDTKAKEEQAHQTAVQKTIELAKQKQVEEQKAIDEMLKKEQERKQKEEEIKRKEKALAEQVAAEKEQKR